MQAFYSSLTMIWAQAPQCLGARKYSFFKQEGAYTQRRGLAFQMIELDQGTGGSKKFQTQYSVKTSPRFTYMCYLGALPIYYPTINSQPRELLPYCIQGRVFAKTQSCPSKLHRSNYIGVSTEILTGMGLFILSDIWVLSYFQ